MKTMLMFLVSGITMLWTVSAMAQPSPTAAPPSQQVCTFKLGPAILRDGNSFRKADTFLVR